MVHGVFLAPRTLFWQMRITLENRKELWTSTFKRNLTALRRPHDHLEKRLSIPEVERYYYSSNSMGNASVFINLSPES